MSQTLIRIRHLFGAALVLPIILLSVQPSFASEDKKVEAMSDIKKSVESKNSMVEKQSIGNSTQSKAEPVNTDFVRDIASGMRIEKTKSQSSSTSDKSNNQELVQPQSGVRGFVFFDLINRSDSTLIRFYASPSYRSNWGPDILPGVLRPGYKRQITLTDNTCIYDVRSILSDGGVLKDFNVNLCNIDSLSAY
ncbi:MAG: hypothetical protein WBA39_13165 [Rivularia sp. (in: cyanobacteria)]